ncbi:MAG: hypothetical protein UT32_C0050G0002 [Parcubacteria group bacterium GW2011_GWC2_39_14]|nr:MAG: hypothetical protein UT32_C0050G0002 [Parcubacteria group bacterium GW2011_GWC2_39_14]KKR52961.1 MAG: hypothetical protein UT91_C0036G0004 [Parcubacteria group bacterium GW2011_GWA2_40_23]
MSNLGELKPSIFTDNKNGYLKPLYKFYLSGKSVFLYVFKVITERIITFACMRCFCPLHYYLIVEKGKNMGERKSVTAENY